MKEVGEFTYGAHNINLHTWNEGTKLKIGKFCSIGGNIQVFLGGNHRIDWISTYPFGHIHQNELGGQNIQGHPATKGDVVIGNDVWLGNFVTIMSGITIGDGAVIVANSHVTKNVDAYEVVGGNPARHIKYRFESEVRNLLLQLRWWDLPVNSIRELTTDLCSEPSVTDLQELIKRYRS